MLFIPHRFSRLLSLSVALSAVFGMGTAHAATKLPQITLKNAHIKEGNSGLTPLTFTATLSAASKTTVTVQYKTVGRTAGLDKDVENDKGTLVFPAGKTTATYVINIIGDTKAEDDETFFVHFSKPVGATLRTVDATGTITNDDGTPTPAPGTGKIVFYSNSIAGTGLFIMNSDGSNLTQVSSNYNDRYPVWSPDGTKIAFYSYFTDTATPGYGLGVMNADGTNRVQLTSTDYNAVKPVWRGDGKALLFHTYGFGSHSAGIYSVSVSGDKLTQLTSGYYDGDPSVSRTTGQIVFSSLEDGTTYTGYSQIYVMNANGTGRVALTSDIDGTQNLTPQISADGKTIVFVKSVYDDAGISNTVGIYAMGPDGTNLKHVIDVYDNTIVPTLSFDGKKVLFTAADDDGVTTTYVADVAKARITELSSSASLPVFSPDSTRLAYVSDDNGDTNIYVEGVNGSKAVQLTTNPYTDTQPDFGVGKVPVPKVVVTPPFTQNVKAPASSSAHSS